MREDLTCVCNYSHKIRITELGKWYPNPIVRVEFISLHNKSQLDPAAALIFLNTVNLYCCLTIDKGALSATLNMSRMGKYKWQ